MFWKGKADNRLYIKRAKYLIVWMYPLKSTTILDKTYRSWRLQTMIYFLVFWMLFFFSFSTSFKRPVQSFIYNGNGDAVETFLQ